VIACPTCSHPVASSAKTCPRCGHAFGALGPEYAAAFAAAPLTQKIAISILLIDGIDFAAKTQGKSRAALLRQIVADFIGTPRSTLESADAQDRR